MDILIGISGIIGIILLVMFIGLFAMIGVAVAWRILKFVLIVLGLW